MDSLNSEVSSLIKFLPKKWQRIVAFLIILVFIAYLVVSIVSSYNLGAEKAKCQLVTIKGRLVDDKNLNRISNAKIEISNGSTMLNNRTTSSGEFFLDGVELPESNIIRLLITPANSTLSQQIDFDLNNTRLYKPKDCIFDLQTIYLKESLKASITNSANKSETVSFFDFVPAYQQAILLIEKKYGLRYSFNKGKLISVKYSGKIVSNESNSNLYYYPGGHVIIEVDGKLCAELMSMKLNATPRFGNPVDEVEKYISADVNKYLGDSLQTIIGVLEKCL